MMGATPREFVACFETCQAQCRLQIVCSFFACTNMVNLPKSRKVTEKKNLIKLTNKGSKKIELQTNLEDVLLVFLQIFSGDRPVWEKQNHEISIAIRQLLSSLKSLLGKRSNDLPLV